jgi:hypothetical protein
MQIYKTIVAEKFHQREKGGRENRRAPRSREVAAAAPPFPRRQGGSPSAALLSRLRRLLYLLLFLAALSLVSLVWSYGWIASPPMVCEHGGDSENGDKRPVGERRRRGCEAAALRGGGAERQRWQRHGCAGERWRVSLCDRRKTRR